MNNFSKNYYQLNEYPQPNLGEDKKRKSKDVEINVIKQVKLDNQYEKNNSGSSFFNGELIADNSQYIVNASTAINRNLVEQVSVSRSQYDFSIARPNMGSNQITPDNQYERFHQRDDHEKCDIMRNFKPIRNNISTFVPPADFDNAKSNSLKSIELDSNSHFYNEVNYRNKFNVERQNVDDFMSGPLIVSVNESKGNFDRGPIDRFTIDRGQIDHNVIDRLQTNQDHIARQMNQGHMDRIQMDRQMNQGHIDSIQMNQSHVDSLQMNQGHIDRIQMNQGHIDSLQMNQGHMDRIQMNQGHMDRIQMNQGHMDRIQMNHGHVDSLQMDRQMNQGQIDRIQMNQDHMDSLQMNQGQMNQKIEYRNYESHNSDEEFHDDERFGTVNPIWEGEMQRAKAVENKVDRVMDIVFSKRNASWGKEGAATRKSCGIYEMENMLYNNRRKTKSIPYITELETDVRQDVEEMLSVMNRRTVLIVRSKLYTNYDVSTMCPNRVSCALPSMVTQKPLTYINFATQDDAERAYQKLRVMPELTAVLLDSKIKLRTINCRILSLRNLDPITTVTDLIPIFKNAKKIYFLEPDNNIEKTKVACAEYEYIKEAISDFKMFHGIIINTLPVYIRFQDRTRMRKSILYRDLVGNLVLGYAEKMGIDVDDSNKGLNLNFQITTTSVNDPSPLPRIPVPHKNSLGTMSDFIRRQISDIMTERSCRTLVIKNSDPFTNEDISNMCPNYIACLAPIMNDTNPFTLIEFIDSGAAYKAQVQVRSLTNLKVVFEPPDLEFDKYDCKILIIRNIRQKVKIQELVAIFKKAQGIRITGNSKDTDKTKIALADYCSFADALSELRSHHGIFLRGSPLYISYKWNRSDVASSLTLSNLPPMLRQQPHSPLQSVSCSKDYKTLVVIDMNESTSKQLLSSMFPRSKSCYFEPDANQAHFYYKTSEDGQLDYKEALGPIEAFGMKLLVKT